MKTAMHITYKTTCRLIAAILFLAVLISCSSDEPNPSPDQGSGSVVGTVEDEDGNSYPNTQVILTNGSERLEAITDFEGNFDITTKDIGAYEITMTPPLSTLPVTTIPAMVEVKDKQTSTVDLVIQTQPVVAHLNFGNVDLLGEIKDKDGNEVEVTDVNEPLYASNVFDDPLGLLTAIKAPDDHHVILSEWLTAKGNVMVSCNGNTSTVDIALEGMIPNGTYTFWLAFLNKTKKVGQSVNFATDLVHSTNPPLGSGTENVVIAGVDGTLTATIQHSSCILTDEVALVIPVIYHINGNTFGAGHTPDEEDVAHMLAYFQ